MDGVSDQEMNCELFVFLIKFYQKFVNFSYVTKSYRITFRAAEPNPFSAKRNADSKKKL